MSVEEKRNLENRGCFEMTFDAHLGEAFCIINCVLYCGAFIALAFDRRSFCLNTKKRMLLNIIKQQYFHQQLVTADAIRYQNKKGSTSSMTDPS